MDSVVFMLVAVCALVATVAAGPLTFPYPLHASCKLDWTFQKSCADVQTSLVNQINVWKNDSNCPNHDNEKCFYSVTNNDAASGNLEATHMTPVKNYVDTLKIKFTTSGDKCAVHAESSSNTWYAVLDYSTNYCNLHNLVTGAGLDKLPGYSETTSNNQCTQYSQANCDKY